MNRMLLWILVGLLVAVIATPILVIAFFVPVSRTTGGSPEPTVSHVDVDIVTERIRDAVASDLGLDAGSLSVLALEGREWPDGCLGLPELGEACASAIVGGYRIVLRGPDRDYVVRSDGTGEVYRIEGGAP